MVADEEDFTTVFMYLPCISEHFIATLRGSPGFYRCQTCTVNCLQQACMDLITMISGLHDFKGLHLSRISKDCIAYWQLHSVVFVSAKFASSTLDEVSCKRIHQPTQCASCIRMSTSTVIEWAAEILSLYVMIFLKYFNLEKIMLKGIILQLINAFSQWLYKTSRIFPNCQCQRL